MEGVAAGHSHSRGALFEADGALLPAQFVGNDRRPAERVEALPPLRHWPPHIADERLNDTRVLETFTLTAPGSALGLFFTVMCIFMGKELREWRARGWTQPVSGLTQFFTQKYTTPLSTRSRLPVVASMG